MTNKILFDAVESGDIESVEKALVEEKINTTTYYGAKSIISATENGHIEILKMILENSAKVARASLWSNSYNIAQSSLLKAVQKGRADMAKLLLEYGAGTEKKDLREAFIEALLSGDLELIKMLLAAGVNVNIKDDKGITPLIYVILFAPENKEILVEWLLMAGANVNVKRETWEQKGRKRIRKTDTALTYAEELGNAKIIEMLKNTLK